MIFDTYPASAVCLWGCEPPFTVCVPHDPGMRIAIGMTDHSAIRARDPPLPHRLDPFYPQAAAGGDLSPPAPDDHADPGRCAAFLHCQPVIPCYPRRILRSRAKDLTGILAISPRVRIIFALRVIPGSLWCVISQTGFCGDHGPRPDFVPLLADNQVGWRDAN